MHNSRVTNGNLNVIGKNIRYYRKLNKLSYQKLSDRLMLYGIDIHKQALYNIEIGKRTVVDYELCALAKCFNITPNELVSDYFNELDEKI